MSARRQSSTTSLSKYARENSPDLSNRSLDFCNAFWGVGDGGVDVLFARMRGASRTLGELRVYWKERSAIEDEYAKRMAKLAKMSLGRDEIGELRNSLDTLRLETDKQSGYHQNLAKQIREDLETPTANFIARQVHHKKNFQVAIEKKFRTKQQQEAHVTQAGEKYKSDCLRINSYTAQASLMQGKELEKIHTKLERAQQTVQANERDFANFAKNLQTTVAEWEQDWKVFCDSCQDQEEERLEFMKDTMWAYANAVSTVCVSDDESCEKMRLALEQMEPEKDMENFVRAYGTGDSIPDPPAFVNYNTTEAAPSGSSRVTSRPASFSRSTQRNVLPRQPPPPPEEPFVNTAGVGAIGRKGTADSTGDGMSRSQSRASNRGATQANGNTPANDQGSLSRRPTVASPHQPSYPGSFKPQNDPGVEPIDPTAETMLKVGNSAYKVDPTNDPQQQQGSSRNVSAAVQNGGIGAAEDPLLKTMAELRSAASIASRHSPSDSRGQNTISRKNTAQGGTSLSPPSSSKNLVTSTSGSRDYRNSAEIVVGSYPGPSRPTSPNPPTAALMQPPPQSAIPPPLANQPVESVITDYARSFPGEGKSISRPNTRNSINLGTTNSGANQNPGQSLARPVSREGHPGIGAHGNGGQSRGASPAPQPGPGLDRRNSRISPAPSASGHAISKGGSIAQRATSPNSVGIALDPSGKVVNDTMADMYNRQQQPQQHPQYNQLPAARNQNRLSGYGVGNNNNIPQAPYGGAPLPPAMYQQVPGHQPQGYVHPTPPQVQQQYAQPVYSQPPPSHFPPPPPTQQPMYQPQAGYSGPGMNGDHLSRRATDQSQNKSYGPNQLVSQPQSQGGGYSGSGMNEDHLPRRATTQAQNKSYNNQLVSPPHPYGTGGRTPSPQPQIPPTGQFTEDGRGVLFYVKALYDYGATIEEEFDFQSGDIIAVTATPEDGWWSGELLDEARRQPGRHVFPSNFVCLF